MALLPVTDALARILKGVAPSPAERTSLLEAPGRILAEDISAQWDQPPFSASAMDGYAVRSTDVAALPITLAVIGEAAAGRPFDGRLGAGQAVRIFTGAPLPSGADAVVIQENTIRTDHHVTVKEGIPDPAHVRSMGGDFRRGATLLTCGTKLTPRTILLAASAGQSSLSVRRKPTVAILATGDELVEPGTTPGAGQIVSSNPYGLAPMIAAAGGEPRLLGIARDTREDLARKISDAADADILVTIGGASVGDHDLVAPALQAAGTTINFWKIAMRPGKPMLFGERGHQRVVGLPGNPVSSMICTRVFVVPLVRAMLGLPETEETRERVRLACALDANGPRAHFMRATLFRDPDGARATRPLPNQDSSLISALAAADCLIVREAGAPPVAKGELVEILKLDF